VAGNPEQNCGAIQERTVRPVGSNTEVSVDVRVLASTNRDPEQALQDRQFRPDLYYRLQASILRVPPLRDRAEYIPLLVQHFIDLFNQKLVRPTLVSGIEDDALQALCDYSWPGNVRERSN
jgi:transcriptional regulator with PAS, ATPase and Fis domain